VLRGIIIVGLFWGLGAMAADFSADGKASVYSNDAGIEVVVVQLRPRTENKVLIRAEGTRTVYDGRVALHDVSKSNGREDYSDPLRKGYVTFFSRNGSYEVVVPGMKDSTRVALNKKKSADSDAKSVVESYYGRRAATAANRSAAETEDRTALDSALAEAKAECKMEIEATIDWKSFDEDTVKKVALSKLGAQALRAMESVCDDDTGREELAKRINAVKVVSGKKLDFALDGKTFKVTVAKGGAAGVWDAGREYLLQKM